MTAAARIAPGSGWLTKVTADSVAAVGGLSALRARLIAPVVASACAASPGVEIVRTGDELTLRAPGAVLAVTLAPSGAITADLDAGQPLRIELAAGALGWSAPAGQIGGAGGLQLTTTHDGAPAWIGSFNGAVYRLWLPADRDALAGVLEAAGLGAPLRAILPYHPHARAWMAESGTVFAVAALADRATTMDPSTWPVATDDELGPIGMLPGDQPGLGMTCSTEIRCPLDAPICVTPTHDQHFGFCTRACLDDRACDRSGRCGLAITDIPGVPDGLTGCYLPCGGDGGCPLLLACTADFAGQPSVCTPP